MPEATNPWGASKGDKIARSGAATLGGSFAGGLVEGFAASESAVFVLSFSPPHCCTPSLTHSLNDSLDFFVFCSSFCLFLFRSPSHRLRLYLCGRPYPSPGTSGGIYAIRKAGASGWQIFRGSGCGCAVAGLLTSHLDLTADLKRSIVSLDQP